MSTAFNPVEARVSSILPGVRDDFVNAYRVQATAPVKAMLEGLMKLNLSVGTGRVERFAFPEATPKVSRWDSGTGITHRSFNYRQWEGTVNRWGVALDWLKIDEEDDQLKALQGQAMDVANRYAMIPWEVAMQQLLGGTANPDLLPGALLAPDGVGIYSALDGNGANRFGTPGGNILTGSGIASEAALVKDLYAAQNRIHLFLDQAGKFRWRPWQGTAVRIFAPFALREVFEAAFKRPGLSLATLNGGTTPAAVNQTANIYVKDIVYAQELTGNSWFVTFADLPPPLNMAERQAPELNVITPQQSGPQAEQGMVSLYTSARALYLLGPCDSTVKVSNA